MSAIDAAVQHIYPLVYEFRKEKPVDANLSLKRALPAPDSDVPGGRRRKRLKRQTSCDSSSESDGIVPDGEEEEADPLTSEEDAVSTSDSDQDDQ